MRLADIVRLNLYATDLDALFQNFTQVTQPFDGNRFDTTVLGVSALASPDVQVALEATAMDRAVQAVSRRWASRLRSERP